MSFGTLARFDCVACVYIIFYLILCRKIGAGARARNYVGYSGDPSSALRVTRRRRLDRKKKVSGRNVYHCFVFGPKAAGKSSLLNSFIGRPLSNTYDSSISERCAVNIVGGTEKTLVLREISEYGFQKFVSKKDALPTCDVAIFVHDSSDESSWKRSKEMLFKVAGQGQFPCLIVAAKDDLESNLLGKQDSIQVSRDMRIKALIPIRMNGGDLNAFFEGILYAAEQPHVSIPRTRNLMQCMPRF